MSAATCLATVPIDWTRISELACGTVPFVVVSQNCVNHAVAIPTAHSVSVFFQRLGNVAFVCAVSVDSYDAFSLLFCVLDFPVHPFTVLSFGCDVNQQRACPTNLWSKDLRLDVVGMIGMICGSSN